MILFACVALLWQGIKRTVFFEHMHATASFELMRINIVVMWWWYHNNELQFCVKKMRKEKWKLSLLQIFINEIRVEKLRWRVCTFVTFANYGCDIFASLDLGSCHGQQCHLHLFCPHPHLILMLILILLLILILILIPKTCWWWCWSGPHTQLHMVLGHILCRLTSHHMVSLVDHLGFYDRPQLWPIDILIRLCIMIGLILKFV